MKTHRNLLASLLIAPVFALFAGATLAEDLVMDEHAFAQLRVLRQEPKFVDEFGIITPEERQMMEPLINDLLDRLLSGLKAHPNKSWVLDQMMPTVEAFHLEDTELRDRCVDYLLRILGALQIKGADGAFEKYYLDL